MTGPPVALVGNGLPVPCLDGKERPYVVVTTIVEHQAKLLPGVRFATRRYIHCETTDTFGLDELPRPRLLAVTGASNITGWLPPLEAIIAAAHRRDIPVVVDAAQLAPHRPLPVDADFIAWSGHKMYAPFGTGVFTGAWTRTNQAACIRVPSHNSRPA